MSRAQRLIHDKSAYTLFEILVVLILLGVVSGGISSIFSATQTKYEVLIEAQNIRSTIRLLQAKAMQYFEQKLYTGTEMRDDDLWGIQFLQNKSINLVRKSFNSSQIKNIEYDSPVWTNTNIYPSHKNPFTYKLTNPCLPVNHNTNEIYFDALGKPVDKEGEQCERDIMILLTAPDTSKAVNLVIKKTGHVMIQGN